MWAQTYKNGNRYYREHKGSRGIGYCVDRGRSMACDVPDNQVGRIVQAIVLPEAWMDRVLARIHLADDVERVRHERVQMEFGVVCDCCLKSDDTYNRAVIDGGLPDIAGDCAGIC